MSLIGKLIYNIYYRPRQKRAMLQKFGGKKSYQAMLLAEQEMKQYALTKLCIAGEFNPDAKYRLNFLTGDRYIHQSLFCLYSFFKFLSDKERASFRVNYYSDGSLGDDNIAILKSRFPFINIIYQRDVLSVIQESFPVDRFPYIHKKLATFPLIKKLLYPNINQSGVSIFLDSDMLFLKRPDAFLNWLYNQSDADNSAFGIHDVQRSYGYTDTQIADVYPTGVKHNVNSGMYAMHSEKIDPVFVEELLSKFETAYGSQYYVEQLITGIIMEQLQDLLMAPADEYIVHPSAWQVTNQQGTLHHYVDASKLFYFKESWQKQLIKE